MTRSDIPRIFSTWWPLLATVGGGLVGFTTLKRDVQESVRVPRFEAESLRSGHDHRDFDRRIKALETNTELLPDICRAVRCTRK